MANLAIIEIIGKRGWAAFSDVAVAIKHKLHLHVTGTLI
jgi:hypothetical protein